MFKINDYVVYGLTGVCQVADIARDEFSDKETEYYVLNPLNNDNLTIKVPVNNEKVVMRHVMTKDDVSSLIAAIPETECLWQEDERQRNMSFKAALKSGSNEELLKVIRTLYMERKARAAAGKKLTKTDEEIMATAENKLNQEFAVALNITPEEVLPYILKNVPK